MKPVSQLEKSSINIVFTDIDDTLTDHGKLKRGAWNALWDLSDSGFKVIPVTGRPAGWCEMIARFWPVHGVIGENGAFYFRHTGGKMKRVFSVDETTRKKNRAQLEEKILPEILKAVPGSAIASDQFCRISDLAIDFCEDVPPLSEKEIQKIVEIFKNHGATAKISSIHVNGWFGQFDKLTMVEKYLAEEFKFSKEAALKSCLFCGDSPNDEPLFAHFPYSVGVANIKNFTSRLKFPPTYVTTKEGGDGFSELADHLLT